MPFHERVVGAVEVRRVHGLLEVLSGAHVVLEEAEEEHGVVDEDRHTRGSHLHGPLEEARGGV